MLTQHSGCGSQADTAIIRDREIASGKATPLGRTQGNGPVDASVMVAAFMGVGAAPPANQGAASSVGVEDNIQQPGQKRQLLAGLLGGKGKAGGAGATGLGGLLGGGGDKNTGPPEASVAAAMGAGASAGMPTAADDGTVTMTLRQVRGLEDHFKFFANNLRSTRMVQAPLPLMWTAHPVELTRPPCSLPPSPKMFLASVSRVCLLLPPPTSR